MTNEPEPRGNTTELFRSNDLVVRRIGGYSKNACVVTFGSFTDHRTLDRAGFGEHFLRTREIDAIHVLSRENDWYQYPEIPEAMAAIQAATTSYIRVVTYGSSMGAYAAIRLAGLVGAHCALSLSPQYSIDPAVTPFEYRWEEASRRFHPLWERTLPFPNLEQAYIAYDPADLDAKHLALLSKKFDFTHVKLPGAGHPVTGYLVELDLLESMVQQACQGPLDVPALTAKAWEHRRESPQYFAVLATRVRKRSQRIEMLQQAAALAPRNADIRCRLAVQLGKASRFKEAIAIHQQALAIEPGHPNLLLHYSYTVERTGDLPGALALMKEAAKQAAGSTVYNSRVAWLQARVAGERVPMPSQWRVWRARLLGRGNGRAASAGR